MHELCFGFAEDQRLAGAGGVGGRLGASAGGVVTLVGLFLHYFRKFHQRR